MKTLIFAQNPTTKPASPAGRRKRGTRGQYPVFSGFDKSNPYLIKYLGFRIPQFSEDRFVRNESIAFDIQ